MKNSGELQRLLANFTGTQVWYRHPLYRRMLYTEGVQAFAECAGGGAYWFLDIVATELMVLQAGGEEFLVVVLDSSDGKARLSADDGNGRMLWQRDIDYTDCPEGVWKFYLTDNVLLLTTEY